MTFAKRTKKAKRNFNWRPIASTFLLTACVVSLVIVVMQIYKYYSYKQGTIECYATEESELLDSYTEGEITEEEYIEGLEELKSSIVVADPEEGEVTIDDGSDNQNIENAHDYTNFEYLIKEIADGTAE